MSIKAILKGTVVALLVTLIFILAMAAVLCFTNVDERTVSVGVYIGTAAGVVAGSFITAKNAKKRVLINCLVTGLVYLGILYGLSFIINGTIGAGYHFAAVSGGVIACSVFGAIIGR